MLDQRLLNFIGSLSSFGERPATARKLANALGAADLIIFTRDPAIDALLPAPGLPQTLPEGRKWREFLSECALVKQLTAHLLSPYDMKPVSVLGVTCADGSIIALLGGSPDLISVIEVSVLIPLLAAALHTERIASTAKAQIDIEIELAQQARTLARGLEDARRELQSVLNEKTVALEKLSESREWFSTTLKCIGDGVIAVNTDGTVAYLNLVAEELTGWKLEEARGKPMSAIFNIVHEKTREAAFNPVEKVLRNGITVGLANHTALIRRDGREFVIEDSAAPIKGEAGEIKGVVLVFRDATERNKSEEEQKQLLDQLRIERDLREKFVATLTHDLRNPLSAAKMSVDLITKNKTSGEQQVKLAARAAKSIVRTDDMIQDLLDAYFIRSGQNLPINLEECDLKAAIVESLEELTATHGDRFTLVSDESIEGFWDCSALRRVFENLASNAIKYGSAETPIVITLKNFGERVTFSVNNQGSTLSEKDQGRIFVPFARTTSAKTSGHKGWGIGLSLVKGFVEAHQGKIQVESTEAAGTTFTVTLAKDARPISKVKLPR